MNPSWAVRKLMLRPTAVAYRSGLPCTRSGESPRWPRSRRAGRRRQSSRNLPFHCAQVRPGNSSPIWYAVRSHGSTMRRRLRCAARAVIASINALVRCCTAVDGRDRATNRDRSESHRHRDRRIDAANGGSSSAAAGCAARIDVAATSVVDVARRRRRAGSRHASSMARRW